MSENTPPPVSRLEWAVRQVNRISFTLGTVNGLVVGLCFGFLIWG